jgi:putative membrane protein
VSGLLLRIVLNGVLIFFLVMKIPGVFVDTLGGLLLGAAIVGIANGILRPLLAMASLPLNWRTLGSVTFFTNILTPFMIIKTLPGFQIYSAVAPVAGVFLMTVCSFTLSKVIQDR